MVNRFEKSLEIGQKDNLFRNLWFLCNREQKPLFDMAPLTFSFRLNESSFSEDLQNFAQIFLSVADNVDPLEVLPENTFVDKYNIERSVYYDFDIQTFRRPPPNLKLANKFQNLRPEQFGTKRFPTLFSGKNLWMLKPSGMNRGRGLELFTSLDELKKFLWMYVNEGYSTQDYSTNGYSEKTKQSPWVDFESKQDDRQSSFGPNYSTPSKAQKPSSRSGSLEAKVRPPPSKSSTTTIHSFIIQKYIERPLLFKGFKFDIRVFALLTTSPHSSSSLSLYLHTEPYCRLSSYLYTLADLNYFIHLTNNAVQSQSKLYGANGGGNVVGLEEVEREIKAAYDRQKEMRGEEVGKEGEMQEEVEKEQEESKNEVVIKEETGKEEGDLHQEETQQGDMMNIVMPLVLLKDSEGNIVEEIFEVPVEEAVYQIEQANEDDNPKAIEIESDKDGQEESKNHPQSTPSSPKMIDNSNKSPSLSKEEPTKNPDPRKPSSEPPNTLSESTLSSIPFLSPPLGQGYFMSRITDLVKTSMDATFDLMNPRHRKQCFEIFGYDFMVDEELKVWLIECNTNPSLKDDSKLLRDILENMLDGAFKLTIDKTFKPQDLASQSSKDANQESDEPHPQQTSSKEGSDNW